jgi:hypothetical protein
MQTATLYPPDLLHFFLPMPWSFGFSAFLHFLLAGVGFYGWAGEFVSTRAARLLAALLYMASGFIVSRLEIGEPTVTQAYAWIPYFLWTGKLLFENPNPRRMAIFAGVCALLFLAGHPHLPFLAAQLFGLLLLCEAMLEIRGGRPLVTFLKPAAALFAGGLLGLMIVSVQAGPFLQFAGYIATRAGGAAYSFAAEGSLPPGLLINQFLPFFWGDPTQKSYWVTTMPYMESSGYLGLVALCLMGVTLCLPRRRWTFLWWFAVLAGLGISLGENAPFHKILFACVPGWDRFRNPGRALLFVTLAGSLLAAYGAESLFRSGLERGKSQSRHLLIVFGGVFLAFLLVTLIFTLEQSTILESLSQSEAERMLRETGRTSAPAAPELFLPRYSGMLESLRVATLLTGLFLTWLLVWLWKPGWRKVWAWCLVLLAGGDLFFFGHRFLQPLAHEEWKRQHCPESEVIQTFREQDHEGRMLMTDLGMRWQLRPLHPELYPNSPMLYRIRTVRGYSPSILKPFSEFINLMQGRPADTLPGGLLFLDEVSEMDPAAVQAMGIETVLSYEKVPSPFMPVQRFSSGLVLFKNPKALGRCFRARSSSNRWNLEPEEGETGATHLLSTSPNRIEVESEGANASTLVFSESAFPGWRVWVNGQEEAIERAFHAFQAVRVPAGKCHVVWEFYPERLGLYMLLSVFGLVVALGLFMAPWSP